MDLLENGFKAALAEGKACIGLWLALADPYATEVSAGAGFDWVVVDGEHAPNDLRSLLSQLQTLAAYPVHPVVRPPVGETSLIKQYLDIGVQNLLVPMVETAEQAAALVQATRYPPEGIRGVGSALARGSRWNLIPSYLQRANDQICLLVQVETQRGLDNLDAIAAVEGVDGVFVGPSDLAAGLGHLGNSGHPDVQAALADAVRRIRAAGKAAGILAMEEAVARRYLDQGYRFVAVGADIALLAGATRALAASLKRSE
ncbi:4-hydroxy-2-oxoheptanedioate aldolase [Oceanibacterium hippocampi]|uniref:4-hydroxy-2-oxo-heptane-1,7-dioate aldolase n=1 Tax=Oceanibacterium hippocampi TaxID=745714 RepID=A0A1Y5TS49_9PROT|nr:4-hydroxy-2-oxoheptanedioate aldolase [Oceanibacterium hippocampi]SLN70801.1 4-hydroxy-2-oxo-heptane-1,7-dioate aldolase [Oceanibacterium hippocampi]